MTEKFVRDCDNVTDIKKVDFIMARQSDLIHTTDGKEWVMNNGKPEQISGAVVGFKSYQNGNKDTQFDFNAESSKGVSTVAKLVMGQKGFEYDADKSIIHNKGVNSISASPSSTVGSGTDGSVYFERNDTKDGATKTLGQLNFKSSDFVVTTADQNGNEVINISQAPVSDPSFFGLTVDPIVTHGDLFWSIHNGNLILDFEDVTLTLPNTNEKVIGTIPNIQVFKNFHINIPVVVGNAGTIGLVQLTVATTGAVSLKALSGISATEPCIINTVEYVPAVAVSTAI